MDTRQGMMLRFYVPESARQGGVQLWEWLLQTGRRLALPGGTALRAVGGFGRQHVLHESRFVELAGHETIVVEFMLSACEAESLERELDAAGVSLVCAQWPLQWRVFNSDCRTAG